MQKKKILVVLGTRPEAIKLAPVIKILKKEDNFFNTVVCVTGQHRHMLDQVMKIFNIKADIDLNIMQENQSLSFLTTRTLILMTKILSNLKPDLVLVQGDTTTAMVTALSAFYQRIAVGHVEAGLRTYDIYNPFPEEVNRCIISSIAQYNFAPTKTAYDVLIRQGIHKSRIILTGNTVVDALKMLIKKERRVDVTFKDNSKVILVTAHRRENWGKPIEQICNALCEIVKRNRDVEVVYPVHLNPNVKHTVYRILNKKDRIHLVAPVEYDQLVYLLKISYLVLTDSGGLQEEAPVLGKPVLVLRHETERPEGIKSGVAKLIGTNTANIIKEVERLLKDKMAYNKMAKAISPYGDGKAAERIVQHLKIFLKK
ncbi:MAG: UDP-N-acetylglucosamine 2-epimerase (non-hydrolyzing) [Candidatus Omnitrophica bacterium]|nr:UDP-N-acetylglucosamine 2-epimerase (non-hydrolyzing) [Candidatus Omnitrophota bacterium]